MPTIGSLDGTFGHGRGPQVAPLPGFTFFPKIGTRNTWTFGTNGAFSFSGNETYSVNTPGSFTQFLAQTVIGAGNVYVITPNSTFLANVKIWAAGGGSGGNALVGGAVNIQGGGAGAASGQILFESGEEYSVVASGGAYNNSSRFINARGGGGGGVSGIFKGNVFANQSFMPLVLAGGGGGAGASQGGDGSWRFPGAGGGNLISQLGEKSLLFTGGGYQYSTNSVGQSSISGSSQFGSTGQVFNGSTAYTGGLTGEFTGAGGGGFRGGPVESGGQGYVASDLPLVSSITGFMSLPALYDDSDRGNAGDSAQPGKVIIYTDEYRLSSLTAIGGTVTDVPIPGYELAYRTHTFTANGKFTITSSGPNNVIDIFAVGGGGGSAGTSGAGGGSVAIRTNFPVPVTANYIVTVGSGGSASDSYATTGVGRIFGGYRGGDSAFFNNDLSRYFPDNYTRLIYSYGKQIRYINVAGDGSNGLTPTTAYPTFDSALAAAGTGISSLIVFAVLPGTYETSTPINDLDQPRVFVCSPGKVTINYTPDETSIVPMMSLGNPHSALYGATIIRTMPNSTDVVKMAFFQGGVQFTSTPRARGSYYNCVFRENGNNWTLVWDQFATPFVVEHAQFKIENCTFFTKNNSLEATGSDATRVLLKNCIFNKAVITNAVQVNCAANVTVGLKYVTSFTDKGVYAGEYGWSSAITVPDRNATLITVIARGGGGAPFNKIADSTVANGSPEYLGGTSPGSTNNGNKIAYIQPEHQANVTYSSYGYPGGKSSPGLSAGGGGAGSPGIDTSGSNSFGGIGIEWPYNSNTYYGNGGSAANVGDISLLAPGTVGKGGGGATPTAGNDGIVIVRYVIPGSYTPPNPPSLRNLIAIGGLVTSTSTYVQHEFDTSGKFIIVRPTNIPNFYIDVITIGGGGGGSGNNHYNPSTTGRPGEVKYLRILLTAEQQISISAGVITIGVGGQPGTYHDSASIGRGGTATTFILGSVNQTSAGGGEVYPYNSPPQAPSVLITDGLFSDNTTRYGGSGGKFGNALAPVPGWGNYGSGGYGAVPNGFHDSGSAGLSGGVIIRYPILPT